MTAFNDEAEFTMRVQIPLKTVWRLLAAFTVAISAGLTVRQVTQPAIQPCTVSNLDEVMSGGEVTFASGCKLLLDETRVITGEVTIHGNGTRIISKTGARLFTVEADASLLLNDVTLTGVTITDRKVQGGAIANHGRLELRGATVTRNSLRNGDGAGIYNAAGARLVLLGGILTENHIGTGAGAALYNEGSVYMHGGYIHDNDARKAAGIYNHAGGTLTLTEVSIAGNLADYAAGIENRGTLQMVGGEIVENEAMSTELGYGAGLVNVGGAVLEEVDISDNLSRKAGVAIHNRKQGVLTVHESIFTGNECFRDTCTGTGVRNSQGTVDLTLNYWGSPYGPGGGGDEFRDNVRGVPKRAYTPYLDELPDWAQE